MKYKPLTGICKTAIEHEYCLGCNKLEKEGFTGVQKCNDIDSPINRIKQILGVQQEIKI